MSGFAPDWLQDKDLKSFCALVEDAGYKALFVGGSVRNPLMDLPVSDIDIATDAHPDQVTKLAKDAGLRVVPTGIDHGTVTVVAGPHPLEVTTFRQDVSTDGRNATVAFGKSIDVDAQRRDFTMNAVYADIRGELFDPTGGIEDAKAGRIRFVGDANRRVQEDYLRILRFFRFTAWYGREGIEAEGLAACAANAEGLERISAERIGAEMRKLLSAPDPWPALAAMIQSGVMLRVLPGATIETAQVADSFVDDPDPIGRLAWMVGEDPTDALRLSRLEARRFRTIRAAMETTDTPGALGYRLGEIDGWMAHVGRQAALHDWPTEAQKQALVKGHLAEFPIKAADLAPLTGADLGARLKQLEAAWIACDFTATKADLLALP